MANLSRMLELAEQLNQKDRAAIIALIDIKTEGDMQAVINKLDVMNSQLNSRFEAMDVKIDALETKMDARIDALEKSISQIKWIVGIIVALAVAASRLLPLV